MPHNSIIRQGEPPGIEIGVRVAVRGQVYRSALQPGRIGCFGFLLGRNPYMNAPVLEIALVAHEIVYPHQEEYSTIASILPPLLPLACTVARPAGVKVIGLFISWDLRAHEGRNALLGSCIDLAMTLDLPFVGVFPLFGGEVISPPDFYHAAWFPHKPLSTLPLPRRSEKPEHNPRRIRSRWKALRKGGS